MPFNLGPIELGLILVIVAMLFGVGKLPEVFGSLGKGVKEFRKEAGMEEAKHTAGAAPAPATPVAQAASAPAAPAAPAQATAVNTATTPETGN